jgi:hypothetical protein
MRILVGFGYYPGTTGIYFQRALAVHHEVTYVGTAWGTQPGFPSDLDLADYLKQLSQPPDLFLYLDSGNAAYLPKGLDRLPCPTAAFFMDAYPAGIPQRNPVPLTLAPCFDYLFIAHKAAIERFRTVRRGLPVYWLPACCDPDIHGDQHLPRIYDVGFVGQVNRSYPERVHILETLEKRYRMNDFRQRYHLHDMARVYSQSKIVVNVSHTDSILPMRFFEAPPSGALLVTKRSLDNGQAELMKEGDHFITFSGQDELLSKIDHYLNHDDEREQIARAGQAYVLAHHTYDARLEQLISTVGADGGQLVAPIRSWNCSKVQNTYMKAYSELRMADAVLNVRPARLLPQIAYAILALARRTKHLQSG